MDRSEIAKEILSDEFFGGFWRRGTHSDGRNLARPREVRIDRPSPTSFVVTHGESAWLGAFSFNERGLATESLSLNVDRRQRFERHFEALLEIVTSALATLFAEQFALFAAKRVDVQLQCLLDEDSAATALFVCAQLCAAAALASLGAPPTRILELHLIRVCRVEADEFVLLDPNHDERTARLGGRSPELVCLAESAAAVSVRGLSAGAFTAASLAAATRAVGAIYGEQSRSIAAVLSI